MGTTGTDESAPASRLPRVSVVIPCFNLGRYLAEAVESVRAQTFQDFEILVVDDGSTEEATLRELTDLAAAGIRVLGSENRGLSAARNLGIANASGEYVSALDADDRFAPEWLERAVAFLEARPDLAFVSHWLRAFGDESWDWQPVRCDLTVLLDYNVLNGAALFRRRLVEDIGGFDESMREGCEDWEFWIRAVSRGHRGAILPYVLYEYRRRTDSMSHAMNRDDTHLRLYASLVAKHPEVYARHLWDLVLRREWTFARLVRQSDALDDELSHRLEPLLEERRRELVRAKARLADIRERQRLDARLLELEAERDEATRLAREVLESRSWRLTSPLRRAYERIGFGPRARHDE